MNDPLEILQSDHHQIERLLDAVVHTEDRQKAVSDVQAAIVQHVEREASIVHASADASAYDADQLAHLAQQLSAAESDAAAEVAIDALRSALNEHAANVEHHLLPSLHARLGETDYLALGDALVRAQHPGGADAV